MRRILSPLVLLPIAKLLVQVAFLHGYGTFRDEFYYLACSERLALGYVDHPPLSIALLAAARALVGDSLPALRLLPALAGALTVLLVGLLARDLGGGRFAQALAMVAVLAAPAYLGVNHVYSMNSFDVVFWALTAWLLARILGPGPGDRPEAPPRLWLVLGLVLGLGLLNKISVLWLGAGLAVGLVATPARRWLRTPWPWAAAGIAILLFAPHLAWQAAHGWPTLEFIRNATGEKMLDVAPLDFVGRQIRMMSIASFPLWLAGLVWLLAGRHPFRPLGWIYVTAFVLLVLNGTSRAGYLGPAYTWLLAAGGVAAERWTARRARWLRPVAAGALVASGLVFAPFGLPVLPVDGYVAYARALGVGPSTEERKELGDLPQHYADMHGWEEIVQTVARVYHSLPPGERREAAIFTPNYGDAGAIDLLGRRHGLPPAVSGHNNYWLWGPRGHSGRVVIVLGGSEEDMSESFEQVERGATIECGRCMPYEDDQPVWIGRRLRRPLAEAWPGVKHFD